MEVDSGRAINGILLAPLVLALVLAMGLNVDWEGFSKPIGCPHCGAPTCGERYRCPECGKAIT